MSDEGKSGLGKTVDFGTKASRRKGRVERKSRSDLHGWNGRKTRY